jgi:hypothetical protein
MNYGAFTETPRPAWGCWRGAEGTRIEALSL